LTTINGIEYTGLIPLGWTKFQKLVSQFRNTLPTGAKLQGIVDPQERHALFERCYQEREPVIHELSEQIMAPLENLIRGKRHLIFIPSGPLVNFPFATLVFEDKPLILLFATSMVP